MGSSIDLIIVAVVTLFPDCDCAVTAFDCCNSISYMMQRLLVTYRCFCGEKGKNPQIADRKICIYRPNFDLFYTRHFLISLKAVIHRSTLI